MFGAFDSFTVESLGVENGFKGHNNGVLGWELLCDVLCLFLEDFDFLDGEEKVLVWRISLLFRHCDNII